MNVIIEYLIMRLILLILTCTKRQVLWTEAGFKNQTVKSFQVCLPMPSLAMKDILDKKHHILKDFTVAPSLGSGAKEPNRYYQDTLSVYAFCARPCAHTTETGEPSLHFLNAHCEPATWHITLFLILRTPSKVSAPILQMEKLSFNKSWKAHWKVLRKQAGKLEYRSWLRLLNPGSFHFATWPQPRRHKTVPACSKMLLCTKVAWRIYRLKDKWIVFGGFFIQLWQLNYQRYQSR